MKVMGAKTAVYVGDSAEDLLMARRAEKEIGVKIAFVGIYGNSSEPHETIDKFKQEGVEAIIRSVNQLSNIINKVHRCRLKHIWLLPEEKLGLRESQKRLR
jgi:phosphoglycolate phosphatase-like HAD superfamily hydrolase